MDTASSFADFYILNLGNLFFSETTGKVRKTYLMNTEQLEYV